MKCFEKAAEKCHSDSLGCVVSSCSWGKHAALGTGSSFEILWNENQVSWSFNPLPLVLIVHIINGSLANIYVVK
jgi:hypothetical protein